jgi:HlyD family secretion protein
MKAKIRVDAFPNQVFTGTARDVAPRPDRSNFSKFGNKIYPTHVEIDQPLPGLRPGMTGLAEIPLGELDNVLSVPVKAVLAYDGKYHVAVKKPGGGFEWRDVSLGLANDEQVEVCEGIKSGETVIVNPITLMSEEERKAKLGNRPRVAPPKRSPIPAIPAQKSS